MSFRVPQNYVLTRTDCISNFVSFVFLLQSLLMISTLTTKATAFAGDSLNATCCASSYPEPVISISGVDMQVSYSNHTSGVYRGCASRTISTSDVTQGSYLTTVCNASLTQRVTCTANGSSNSQVPQQVVNNCIAALTKSVLVSSNTLIAGE